MEGNDRSRNIWETRLTQMNMAPQGKQKQTHQTWLSHRRKGRWERDMMGWRTWNNTQEGETRQHGNGNITKQSKKILKNRKVKYYTQRNHKALWTSKGDTSNLLHSANSHNSAEVLRVLHNVQVKGFYCERVGASRSIYCLSGRDCAMSRFLLASM